MSHDPTPNDRERSGAVAWSGGLSTARPVPAADEAVINRYESNIRRFCKSRTQTPEDGEDAAQDTFIRFLRRSGQHVRNPEAWLITAATRACIDINRKRQRDQRFVVSPKEDRGTPLEDRAHRIADQRSVNPEQLIVEALWITSILRRLSERDRIVITHLYLMGRSLRQLASFLGVSYDNAKVIAQRARRHVRALLAESPTLRST